jgi:hypothetical protein
MLCPAKKQNQALPTPAIPADAGPVVANPDVTFAAQLTRIRSLPAAGAATFFTCSEPRN